MLLRSRLDRNSEDLLTLVIMVLGFQGMAIVWVNEFLKMHEVSWGGAFGFAQPIEPAEHIVVQRERFVVALPARHRLARLRGRIAMREIAEEVFVMVPRRSPSLMARR